MNRSHAVGFAVVSICLLVSAFSFLSARQVSAQTIACTDLPYDLYYGLSDGNTDNKIFILQKYLAGSGYLTATPNGRFGPATLSAVKAFQSSRGISSTGRVGPQTRAMIKSLSCTTYVAPATPVSPVVQPDPQTLTIPVSSELTAGTKYTITWHPRSGTIYNLTIDDQYGIGAGYIASNVSGGSYEWTVGEVYSARTRSNMILQPGKYSIRAQDVNKGALPTDERSPTFTLLGKPIVISSVMPASVPNDDKTSVVVYGSGFDSSTRVRFDGISNGVLIAPLYISPDGRVLVFTVPWSVYPAVRYFQVNNAYESGATSTPSNAMNIIITP